MLKRISYCEALAYSTLTACGQNVDFITVWADANKEKNNFLTIFQYTPFISQCQSFELHGVAPETQQQFWLVQNLDLRRLQLPATGVKQLQPPQTHTHSKSGATGFTSHRAGGFESSEWVRWKRSPDNMQIRLTALSQETSQHRIGLVSATDRGQMKNVQFHRGALSTSAYWLKYILTLLSNSQI